MKQFFYRIRGYRKNDYDSYSQWDWSVLDLGIVEAENKKECRLKIEVDYDKKLCMKSKKEDIGVKNHFLVNIYELNDYWRKVWLEKIRCVECGYEYTFLEHKQVNDYIGHITKDYCTEKCYITGKQKEYIGKCDDAQKEAYERCDRGYIYKITNKLTKKSYIGQTIQPLTLRWWQHINANNTKKFGEALETHKLTDWTFEALEDAPKDKLVERERHYIEKFNSIDNGYNSV